jgi:hypothetical protein
MVFVIIEIQSINCTSVITKGGAKRMILPCVGFANNPLSLSFIQISQAVELSSVSFIKIAFNNHLPLTDLTKSFVLQNSVNSCLNIFPNLSALIANSSSATTSKAAIATAAAIGFPPNVEP